MIYLGHFMISCRSPSPYDRECPQKYLPLTLVSSSLTYSSKLYSPNVEDFWRAWTSIGGDTSTTKEASKEAPRKYKLRRNTMIRSHPYQVNNMLILTMKFNNLLEDMYKFTNFEDIKMSKPMKMGVPLMSPYS